MITYFTLFITMFSLTLGAVDCLAAKASSSKKKKLNTTHHLHHHTKAKIEKPSVIIEETKIAPIHINVKELKSPEGFKFWFVQNNDIPVVTVSISFENAGHKNSPEGFAGLVTLLSSTLDEGAGNYNSDKFKKLLLEKNIQLFIDASADDFTIRFRTVKERVADAFNLINLILTQPRFDSEQLKTVKDQISSMARQSLNDENSIAGEALYKHTIVAPHPYIKKTKKIIEEVVKIEAPHLKEYLKYYFAKDNIVISAAGDISEADLAKYIDQSFSGLPEKMKPCDIKDVAFQNLGSTKKVSLDVPQSVILFLQPGIRRDDPDFYVAYMLSVILGGNQLGSRLFDEVRDKRGLVYGCTCNLIWTDHMNYIIGSTATNTESVDETIKVIREVWDRISREGVTEKELNLYKRYLTGSYALRFSSTLEIASLLTQFQLDKLPVDFINKRNEILEKITAQDMNRVAEKLFHSGLLSFVVVGREKFSKEAEKHQ